MDKKQFEKAQSTLSTAITVSVAVGLFYGIDGYNLIMDNDLSAFGAVAYPLILAVSSVVAITALAVKVYGYRLAKTYR